MEKNRFGICDTNLFLLSCQVANCDQRGLFHAKYTYGINDIMTQTLGNKIAIIALVCLSIQQESNHANEVACYCGNVSRTVNDLDLGTEACFMLCGMQKDVPCGGPEKASVFHVGTGKLLPTLNKVLF